MLGNIKGYCARGWSLPEMLFMNNVKVQIKNNRLILPVKNNVTIDLLSLPSLRAFILGNL